MEQATKSKVAMCPYYHTDEHNKTEPNRVSCEKSEDCRVDLHKGEERKCNNMPTRGVILFSLFCCPTCAKKLLPRMLLNP